jgi:hypothetical protein
LADPIHSYREFWPYYLREHAKPATRRWHIAGTTAAVVILMTGIVSASLPLVLASIVIGYLPAWVAHFLIEGNRPATFRYPLWSLISDFRMAALWFSGGLARELAREGIEHKGPPP